mgnify:FL=1
MSTRTVISADHVAQAAANGRLTVPKGALITPLARDRAADLGVTLEFEGSAPTPVTPTAPAPTTSSDDDLTQRIRTLVTSMLANDVTATAASRTRPVKLCRASEAVTEPFPYPGPKPGQQVRTGDVVTSDDGSPMAAGYMTLTEGSFPWEFSYDEIQIVLEGELHIGTPEGTRIAKPGDIMYVPKGSTITFGTPSWTKFVYVTFPADWESGL